MKNIIAVLLVTLLMPVGAAAQTSDELEWKLAPYLWTVGISGDLAIGSINQDLDVSFSDILSDFDFGGSIYGELAKGSHGVHVDYTYIRLKPDPTALPTPPFPAESTLSTKMTTNIFETAYHYRFDDLRRVSFLLGARYMDIEMRMTPDISEPSLPIEPPIEPPLSGGALEVGPSWWDFFVGIKTQHQISQKWDFGFYGTIGTGGSDFPWTVQAMFGRRYSNDNRLGLGLRIWGIDYSENEGVMSEYTAIDATFYGLMIGYEFN